MARFVGKGLVLAAPKLMKALTIIGTVAMFMVGGGILSHGLPPVYHAIAQLGEMAGLLSGVVSLTLDVLVGLLGGALALVVVKGFAKIAEFRKV